LKEFTDSKDSKLVIDCRTIILNLVSSIIFDGMWITYSRQKKDYKKCNDKNAWMKYDNMLFVTKQLEMMGFISQKIGYFDIKNDWKNSTKMMPTYKFYQFCLQNKVDHTSFFSEIQVINTKRDELVFKEPKDFEYKNGKQIKKSKSIDVT
jgi:hypothetical protein